MCRRHLVGAPSERKAVQERVEVGVAFWYRMGGRPRGEVGEMVLDGADLVRERKRVQRAEHINLREPTE